jgi:glycerophosphoryl diester phosphodiesterase
MGLLAPALLPRPLVYAHRGGAAVRPENTIEAFDHGLALGADGLELDVRLSRDGVVVVHHDEALDRTTDGRGAVSDFTADELGRLDAGYWFQPRSAAGDPPAAAFPFRGRGCRLPLLRDVLARYRDARFIIELKTPQRELARRAIDAVRASGAIDRVAIGSFYWRAVRAARQYDPAIVTGAAQEETRWALYRAWARWPIGSTGYREFQVPERSGSTRIVSPRFVSHVHRAGLPVKVWTVDDPGDMRRLLSWGVDALISDRPDLAVGAIAALNPRDCP